MLKNRDQLSDVKLKFLHLFARVFFALIKVVDEISIESFRTISTMIRFVFLQYQLVFHKLMFANCLSYFLLMLNRTFSRSNQKFDWFDDQEYFNFDFLTIRNIDQWHISYITTIDLRILSRALNMIHQNKNDRWIIIFLAEQSMSLILKFRRLQQKSLSCSY